MSAIAQGLGIGLAIAAPVGPIGLLTIRRTLADGPARGLATGLGAAVADTVYGLAAALGVGALAAALQAYAGTIRLAGAALLLWLGVAALHRAWHGCATYSAQAGGRSGLAGAFATTFVLTLANPATIISFAGVVAALAAPGASAGVVLVAGVFIGSAAWWCFLVAVVSSARQALPGWTLRGVEAASGCAFVGFALATAWHVFSKPAPL